MARNLGDGISRIERAALARKLRDRDFTYRQIAAKLGVSRGYALSLIADPDGSKERARKERYRGTCSECGGKTTYTTPAKSATRCRICALKHQSAERKWTGERIIEDMRRWNDIYGEPPRASQWLLGVKGDGTRNSRPWPHVAAVQREFGSWSNGLEAAGFERRHGYERTPEWKAKRTKWPKERVVQELRRWADEHGRTPTSYDFRFHVGPTYSTVVARFGSWENALREAGLTPQPRSRRRASSNGTMPPVPSFAERGEGTALLKVVQDLYPPQKGRSLLEVVRELPERS